MKQTKAGAKKKPETKSSAKSTTKSSKSAATKRSATAASAAKAAAPQKETTTRAETPRTTDAPAPKTPVVTDQPELPATHGKVSVFGGPKDRGIKPDDKLALPTGPHGVYERIRSLNPKSFYCAMRWNYHVQHMTPEDVKRWWANKKLRITNGKTGISIVARAVDYGPHQNTGLDIGISPGAAEALGVEVGDEVDIALADPKLPLGPQ
jgi:hypothetical protein